MTRKVLLRAAEIVEQGWTQRCGARDAQGMPVAFSSPEATSWCLLGAVAKADAEIAGESSQASPAYSAPLRMVFIRKGYAKYVMETMWNDAPERTADEVATFLREAAAMSESVPHDPRS